jgi:hypothetical protein
MDASSAATVKEDSHVPWYTKSAQCHHTPRFRKRRRLCVIVDCCFDCDIFYMVYTYTSFEMEPCTLTKSVPSIVGNKGTMTRTLAIDR